MTATNPRSEIHWRKRKQGHAILWAILLRHIDPKASWVCLFEWARLGGNAKNWKELVLSSKRSLKPTMICIVSFLKRTASFWPPKSSQID